MEMAEGICSRTVSLDETPKPLHTRVQVASSKVHQTWCEWQISASGLLLATPARAFRPLERKDPIIQLGNKREVATQQLFDKRSETYSLPFSGNSVGINGVTSVQTIDEISPTSQPLNLAESTNLMAKSFQTSEFDHTTQEVASENKIFLAKVGGLPVDSVFVSQHQEASSALQVFDEMPGWHHSSFNTDHVPLLNRELVTFNFMRAKKSVFNSWAERATKFKGGTSCIPSWLNVAIPNSWTKRAITFKGGATNLMQLWRAEHIPSSHPTKILVKQGKTDTIECMLGFTRSHVLCIKLEVTIIEADAYNVFVEGSMLPNWYLAQEGDASVARQYTVWFLGSVPMETEGPLIRVFYNSALTASSNNPDDNEGDLSRMFQFYSAQS